MITDFHPIPEIGCRYRSKAGDYYIIKDFQTDLGAIPDYVEIVCENSPSGPPIEHEAEEWNALEAEKVSMSEPVSNPKPNPQTSDPQKIRKRQTRKKIRKRRHTLFLYLILMKHQVLNPSQNQQNPMGCIHLTQE